MGDVFLARHPITGLEVALKLLKPALVPDRQHVQRFLTEARHMYHLNHPHILRIMEVWDPPAGPYYVMPYMEHGSLAGQIRPGQPADYVFVLRVARQIAEALAYAHSKGIIHRDLKPLNVLMDGEGRAFLSDFGLVRAFNTHDPDLDVQSSAAEGTACYMSPAVARGEAEDTRCDIYSFGAMLYELLTGCAPYAGKSSGKTLRQLLAGPPQPIFKRNPHAPSGLVKIAEWAMARELRDRYSSMADVLADLARLENEKPAGLGRMGGKSFRWPAKWLASALQLVVGYCRGGMVDCNALAFHHQGANGSRSYQPRKQSHEPATGLPTTNEPFTNTLGMKFVRIEPGTFMMGSPFDEPGHRIDETLHRVTLTHPYMMAATDVTRGAVCRLQKSQPGTKTDDEGHWQNPGFEQTDEHPVVCMSWNDAMAFCYRWLQRQGAEELSPSDRS